MEDDKNKFTENAPGNSGYYSGKVQPIHYNIHNLPESLVANVIKYVSRYKKKNGKEDLQKALWYLNLVNLDFEGAFDDSFCSMDDLTRESADLDEDQKAILRCIDELVWSTSVEKSRNCLSIIKSDIEKILRNL